MANPSKAKGTRAETKVVNFLKAGGLEAKRQPLSGNKDIGDIICRMPGYDKLKPFILEVKTGKQTENPSRSQLIEWWNQADVEASNAKGNPILVVVRYRRKLEDADVWFRYCGLMTHMYLDEFVHYASPDWGK